MRKIHFLGSRIVKTGIAIFLTAVICEWFQWPAVFAVITAIVTIEPTVSDSIKKGIVRFPASAIGSAYAVLFIALYGNSPITYTLAAVLTILTCYKFKLHAGLLVATLTAVAMVEVIHSNYLIAFFIRLGTTTTGLLVSIAVNMIVFRPDYRKEILKNFQKVSTHAGKALEKTFQKILYDVNLDQKENQLMICELNNEILKTKIVIRFQRDEANLHPLLGGDKLELQKVERQLSYLHHFDYHLGNLLHLPSHTTSWSSSERDIIMLAVTELANDLQDSANYNPEKHKLQLKKITDLFWEGTDKITKDNEIYPTQFPPELIILYELISIYHLVDQYHDI